MIRSTLITLLILSGVLVASGFAAPMVAVHVAGAVLPIFGGQP